MGSGSRSQKYLLGAMAERHGNRTHPGREHRPADGFEDRAGHQTGSRSRRLNAPLRLTVWQAAEGCKGNRAGGLFTFLNNPAGRLNRQRQDLPLRGRKSQAEQEEQPGSTFRPKVDSLRWVW